MNGSCTQASIHVCDANRSDNQKSDSKWNFEDTSSPVLLSSNGHESTGSSEDSTLENTSSPSSSILPREDSKNTMRKGGENFYAQQIFGGNYSDHLQYISPTSIYLPRQTFTSIDPVVHHRTPKFQRQDPVRSFHASFIGSRSRPAYNRPMHSIPSITRRPLPPKPVSPNSLSSSASPLSPARSVGGMTSFQRTLPRYPYENRSARSFGGASSIIGLMGYHSFDEGLDYHPKDSNQTRHFGSVERSTLMQKNNFRSLRDAERSLSREMTSYGSVRGIDYSGRLARPSFPLPNRQLPLRRSEDGLYKTVLYVTSTPRGSMTSVNEASSHHYHECSHRQDNHSQHRHLHQHSSERMERNNRAYDYICSKCGKRGSRKHRKVWPQEQANYSLSEDSLRHAVNDATSLEHIKAKKVELNSMSDQPRIIFQGPGRYLEERPYYGTVPSPQQMHVTIQESDDLVAPEPSPLARASPLKLAHHDFNQVVVDIKPRQMQEADRQQHISHWINSSSIDAFSSDGLSNKPESGEPSAEHNSTAGAFLTGGQNDLVMPVLEHRVNQPRLQSEPFQLTVNPEVSFTLQTTGEVPRPSSESSNTPTLHHSTVTTTNIKTEPPTQIRLFTGKLVDPVPLLRATISYLRNNRTEFELHSHQPHECPTKTADKMTLHEERIKVYRPKEYEPMVRSSPFPKGDAQMRSPDLNRPLPMIPTRGLGQESRKKLLKLKLMPKPPKNEPRAASTDSKMGGVATQARNAMTGQKVLPPEHFFHPAGKQSDALSPNVRSLAAFFTEIIRRQSEPWSSLKLEEVKHDILYGKVNLDKHRVPSCVSPYLLHRETSDEQEKRLQAVDTLRRRGCSDAIPDYTKPSMPKLCVTYRDYNPYTRPASAPRYDSGLYNGT